MARTDTLTNYLTDVATAIKNKKGDSTPIQASNFDTEIANLPSGGGTIVEEKDVNFYDYDGTLLYSYTAQEFSQLTSMPDNPTHTGLTAQGWNWTLQEAKTYLSNGNTFLDIGQLYKTDDNKTRIYIELDNYNLSPTITFAVNGTVTINWGDGSSQNVSGTSAVSDINTRHTYFTGGNYVITLYSTSKIQLSGSSAFCCINNQKSTVFENYVYCTRVKKIELGTNIVFDSYCFSRMLNLETITMPTGTSNDKNLNSNMFRYCYLLKHLNLSTNTLEFYQNSVSDCPNIRVICLSSKTTYIAQGAFSNNSSIKRLSLGNITAIPSTIGSMYGIRNIEFANLTTFGGTSVFSNDMNIKNIKLGKVTNIPNSCFASCYSLSYIFIPKTVTSLGTRVFQNNYAMKYIDFSEHTAVPTLADANSFSSIGNTTYRIIVPDNLYNTWISTSPWSTISSYIVKASTIYG